MKDMTHMYQITSIAQALQSFDIKKYQEAKKLTPRGWASALLERIIDIDSLNLGRSVFDKEDGWEDRIIFKYLTSPCDSSELNFRDEDSPERKTLVSDASILEIFDRHRLFEDTELKTKYTSYTNEWMNADDEAFDNITTPKSLLVSSDIEAEENLGLGLYEALLSVNLGASDDLIVASFQSWLKARRKLVAEKHGDKIAPTHIIIKHLKRWEQLRLLAYIDLVIFSVRYKSSLPYHRVGTLLFPDEYDIDTSERVRKVIHPEAKFVLQDNTMMSLQAFAFYSSDLEPE